VCCSVLQRVATCCNVLQRLYRQIMLDSTLRIATFVCAMGMGWGLGGRWEEESCKLLCKQGCKYEKIVAWGLSFAPTRRKQKEERAVPSGCGSTVTTHAHTHIRTRERTLCAHTHTYIHSHVRIPSTHTHTHAYPHLRGLCAHTHMYTRARTLRTHAHTPITGWRRLIGCLTLQVVFRKRANNYRALLRKMTYKNKVSSWQYATQ